MNAFPQELPHIYSYHTTVIHHTHYCHSLGKVMVSLSDQWLNRPHIVTVVRFLGQVPISRSQDDNVTTVVVVFFVILCCKGFLHPKWRNSDTFMIMTHVSQPIIFNLRALCMRIQSHTLSSSSWEQLKDAGGQNKHISHWYIAHRALADYMGPRYTILRSRVISDRRKELFILVFTEGNKGPASNASLRPGLRNGRPQGQKAFEVDQTLAAADPTIYLRQLENQSLVRDAFLCLISCSYTPSGDVIALRDSGTLRRRNGTCNAFCY